MTPLDDKTVPLASATPAVVDGPSASVAGGTSAPVVDGPRRLTDAADRTSPVATRPTGRRRTDYSAAPISARDLATIVVQLALATVFVWQFELEQQRHLLGGMLAVFGGFLVNVYLPPRFRPAWFLAISVVVLFGVLGWSDGLFALSIAGSLIAATAIPIPLAARFGLILVLGATFAWMRSTSTALFWPVVGSMFMFRMISYIDASRKNQGPRTLVDTAGYFLMLPNSLFALFPVIDAKGFRDTWYNDEPRTIYQTGVHWIAAGILHLVLYRLIKYEVLPSPLAVRTPSDALLYLATNYALYLRVSGHFHLVCGMLHLFGWNLPRTHDHYFLAASFSEIWRRINIYWKDFLMKTFFYPAYFRIRGRLPGQGQRRDEIAIAISVVWVFFWTWLAHSWQTFWILGRFPFLAEHGAAWLVVGSLVAINSVIDYRRTLRAPDAGAPITAAEVVIHALQVNAMFVLVAIFWGLWSNKETLLFVMQSATEAPVRFVDALWILGAMSALGTAAAIEYVMRSRHRRARRQLDEATREAAFRASSSRNLVVLTVALIVSVIPADQVLSVGWAARWRGLRREQTTAGDALANIDGYYEQLNEGSLQAGPYLVRGETSVQQDFAGQFLAMVRPSRDIQLLELIPGWEGEFDGAKTTVNRWGMRDKPRTLAKPPETRRIAIVGSSIVMGLGVDDDHTISQELERLLNAAGNNWGTAWEVLNFGMGRTYAVERRAIIEHKVLAFQPDVILYVAHQDEYFHLTRNLGRAFAHGFNLEDPALDELIREHGLSRHSTDYEIEAGFNASSSQILELTYKRLSTIGQQATAKILFVYLPIPGEHQIPSDPTVVIQMAEANGLKSIDLTGWWGDWKTDEVVGSMDQYHPRKLGTRLIAVALLDQLRKMDSLEPISQP
jgi:hypothetical protein